MNMRCALFLFEIWVFKMATQAFFFAKTRSFYAKSAFLKCPSPIK